MITPLDLQKWQTATNGINASGQQDLTGNEWSALIALNGCLQNGNFESDESRHALALLKDNLNRHTTNAFLQMHLQNYIALCEQYAQTNRLTIPPAANPATLSPETVNSNAGKAKGGSNKKLILIIVALIIGYLLYSHWDAVSGEGLPNGRYELANPIGAGSLPDNIVISGSNFSTEWSILNTTYTIKYKYQDGKITFTDKGMSVSVPCEFKNGSLWYGGMEYKKVK